MEKLKRRAVEDAVFNAIERQVGGEVETNDTYASLWLDSLDVVEIIIEIEKELKCKDLDDVVELASKEITVGQIIDEICKYLKI